MISHVGTYYYVCTVDVLVFSTLYNVMKSIFISVVVFLRNLTIITHVSKYNTTIMVNIPDEYNIIRIFYHASLT